MAYPNQIPINDDDSSITFSILMPSFNQGNFITEAIESVLGQKDVSLELIVKDNISSDNTIPDIESLSKIDSRIRFITFKDSGPASALNHALGIAKGKYIGCLNSDDYYLLNALKNVADYLDRNEDVDIIYGNGFESIDSNLRVMLSDKFTLNRYKLGISRVVHQATFYRHKSLLDKAIRFNPENKTCWDTELLIDATLNGLKVEKMESFFGVMRVHSSSITGSQRLAESYEIDKSRILKRLTLFGYLWQFAGSIIRPFHTIMRRTKSVLMEQRTP
jgi:glycosyltransferase involved in cell wall biosynthesis